MSDNNQQYGLIRELGDYSKFKELNEEQNEQYKQQLINEQQLKREERRMQDK